MAKFHEKAKIIYGLAQKAQGSPVYVPYVASMGTITTTVGSKTVTGSGTQFTVTATERAYIYHNYNIVGQIDTIVSDTQLTLVSAVPASATIAAPGIMGVNSALSGATYSFGLGPANALATLNFTYSDTFTTESNQFIGSELDRYEDTAITDSFCSFDFETLMPILGSIPSTTVTGTGTISVTSGTTNVTGVGSLFLTDIQVGDKLTNAATGSVIGVVKTIYSDTYLDLVSVAKATLSEVTYKIVKADRVPLISEIPLPDWFQGVGLGLVLTPGSVEATNSVSSNTFLTIEMRLSSADLASSRLEKVYRAEDARGTLDITTKVGTKSKLKFNFMGNLVSITDATEVIPDYGNQKLLFAEVLKRSNITVSALVPYYASINVIFPATIAGGSTVSIAGLTYTAPASGSLSSGTGTIVCGTTTAVVTGTGTSFTTQLANGDALYKTDGTFIGIVNTIASDTSLRLYDYAKVTLGSTTAFKYNAAANVVTSRNLSTYFRNIAEGTAYGDVPAPAKGSFTAGTLTGYSTYAYGLFGIQLRTSSSATNINAFDVLGTATGITFSVASLESVPADPTVSNFCFEQISAPKINGFDYTRYLTSCEENWARGAVPTDVSLTVIEDKAAATYNPYEHLEERHKVFLKYGSTLSNSQVTISYDKAQLTKIAQNKVGTFNGQDLGFRNIGNISLIFN